ncbi:Ninja-family protein 2 [Platanthera zijinensis]|uniref:Ninja-family protein n=1 Tax=Platanthera zijinensis TaxID=2320716 RepID=A0AAP0GBJ6_9ASPA
MEAALCEEETEHALFYRSSDLLRGFCGGFSADELAEDAGDGDSDEIDLGLSLGGCFSSADSKKKRILRSSSIPSIHASGLQSMNPLSRASSLPSETGREMQRISRAEAKRKMGERFEGDLEGGSMAKVRKLEIPKCGSWITGDGPPISDFCPAISSWIAGATPPDMSEKSVPPASQGSNVSQGSSSPGGSELESRPGQGFSNGSKIRRAVAEHKNHNSPSSPSESPRLKTVRDTAYAASGGGLGNPLRKNDGGRRGSGRIAAEEMPLVSTRGDGRNGRRIQGFLYKCGRGEVRIVCVCHGSFLTPAEFVKHGGGGDVAHPLKHIIVNPSSPPFL